jgi:putative hydrolase of the HAD superfamily
VLQEWNIDPTRFVMVGNSVPSDMLPIVELGGHGIHVPYHVTWAHETVADSEHGGGFTSLGSIADLPNWLAG